MKVTQPTLAILAFGLVALIGLIVLGGTGHLDDAILRDTLQSVVFASLAAAAGMTVPQHFASTAPPVVDDPAVLEQPANLSSG